MHYYFWETQMKLKLITEFIPLRSTPYETKRQFFSTLLLWQCSVLWEPFAAGSGSLHMFALYGSASCVFNSQIGTGGKNSCFKIFFWFEHCGSLLESRKKKITLFLSFVLVSKVNFLCLPYPSCQRGDTAAGENGGRGGSETKGKPECSSWQTAEWQKWKEVCTRENQVSLNPVSDSRVWGDSDKNWFMCETDLDMAELQQNLSSSGITVKTLPT